MKIVSRLFLIFKQPETSVPFTKLDNVECLIQECPSFIKSGCLELFPNSGLKKEDHLTVMTVSQRTNNDMTSWSEEVENEREELFQIVSMLSFANSSNFSSGC